MLSVEIAFIAIAFISLPNLFYRGEFNVPLLLFAAVCWQNYTSSTAYLLIISWAIELYRLLTLLVHDDPHLDTQRKPLLLASTIAAFLMKIALIIYLIVKNQAFRNAVKPAGFLVNVAKSIKGED